MFTGIVEAVGRVTERREGDGAVGFQVRCPELAPELREGESLSVDGVCQTVSRTGEEWFAFRSVATTLARTTAGEWHQGRTVNLERGLAVGDRLDGHLVQGHVDGVGTVRSVRRGGETVVLAVELPAEVARVTVPRGSVALDGVSLTVAELDGPVAEMAIVPYTWAHTNLDRLAEGSRMNVEADLIGKYAARLLAPYRPEGTGGEGS